MKYVNPVVFKTGGIFISRKKNRGNSSPGFRGIRITLGVIFYPSSIVQRVPVLPAVKYAIMILITDEILEEKRESIPALEIENDHCFRCGLTFPHPGTEFTQNYYNNNVV